MKENRDSVWFCTFVEIIFEKLLEMDEDWEVYPKRGDEEYDK